MVVNAYGAGSGILAAAGEVYPVEDVAAFVGYGIVLLPNIKVVVFEVKILGIKRFFFGGKVV